MGLALHGLTAKTAECCAEEGKGQLCEVSRYAAYKEECKAISGETKMDRGT
jgi:hypothetical protein